MSEATDNLTLAFQQRKLEATRPRQQKSIVKEEPADEVPPGSQPYVRSRPSAAESKSFVGRKFIKNFPGYGDFVGNVIKFDTRRKLYKVRYSDGDEEELEIEELRDFLDTKPKVEEKNFLAVKEEQQESEVAVKTDPGDEGLRGRGSATQRGRGAKMLTATALEEPLDLDDTEDEEEDEDYAPSSEREKSQGSSSKRSRTQNSQAEASRIKSEATEPLSSSSSHPKEELDLRYNREVWEQRYSSCKESNKKKQKLRAEGAEVETNWQGPRKPEHGGTRKPGESWPGWKELSWQDLDRIGLSEGRITLKHNSQMIFHVDIKAGESVAENLKALSTRAKFTPGANPKITGFVKVSQCSSFNGKPLPALLQESGLFNQYPSSWSSLVQPKEGANS